MLQKPHVFLTFEKVRNSLCLPRETTSEPPKVAQACGALHILTWKCASRHNGVHFFDILTSKSDPDLAFWLRNVLRTTTACTFSTSQLPKVVREWCALYILTSTCASRHNSVQFFISHLARWLRTRRFSEPTFRPSGLRSHKSLEKHTVLGLSYLFAASASSFFWLFPLLWSSLFYSSLLSESSHLCFSSVHIVGSLTSKLPSTIIIRNDRWDIDTLTSQLQSDMWIENTCNVATKTGCEHQWFAQHGHMTLQLWPFTSYKYEH